METDFDVRARAMELAIALYPSLERPLVQAQAGDPEKNSRRLLLTVAKDIYNFLKG